VRDAFSREFANDNQIKSGARLTTVRRDLPADFAMKQLQGRLEIT
jgi:hypothetical protein